MDLLTKDEGLQYLQDVLGIPISGVPNLSDTSVSTETKLSFLETLIRAFLEREPFQSIYLMSHDITSRRRPSWEEIKRDILLGRGGLCYWLNAFMYALLSSLGFNASMTFSTYNVGTYCPNNHLVVFVHDLETPGSHHLVDVGLGYYIPRAISLDFVSESPEYTDSFMTYKFQRESETMMSLLKKVPQDAPAPSSGHAREQPEKHQKVLLASNNHDTDKVKSHDNLQEIQPIRAHETDPRKEANQNQLVVLNGEQTNETIPHFTWQKIYFFNPLVALKNLEAFFPCFDHCFGDVTKLSTHSSPRAMCWPNGRFLALVNSKLIQENEPGKLTKSSIIDFTVRSNPPLARKEGESAKENTGQKLTNAVLGGFENTKARDKIVLNSNNIDATDEDKLIENPNLREPPEVEPLVEAYGQYFPQLPSQMVRAAVRNWFVTGTLFPLPQHVA